MDGNGLTQSQQLAARVLTIEQTRKVDQLAIDKYHMNSLVLMENAGLECVNWLQRKFGDETPKVVILCGTGNNGGDGLVIARHLRVGGWPCDVVVRGQLEDLSADANANARILLEADPRGVKWWDDSHSEWLRSELLNADLIIDAMLGTGAAGDPRPPFDRWILDANQSDAYRVAIDIPTGVNAETGDVGQPVFLPAATLTFVAKKPAMAQSDSAKIFGDLQVLPIGLPEQLIRSLVDASSAN